MITVHGSLYKEGNSIRHLATLEYNNHNVITCHIEDEQSKNSFNHELSKVDFSSRIGNTARFIYFTEKRQFETSDNDAIDEIIKSAHQQGFLNQPKPSTLAHALESNVKFILLSIALLVLSSIIFVQYGVPYFSKEIARMLPVDVMTKIGEGGISLLDQSILEKSELPKQRQQILQQEFSSLIDANNLPIINQNNNVSMKLIFRKSEPLGANAFALPSGDILFTDEMIQLAKNDNELKTIMLHEIGHLVNRHSLRKLIQQSSLALLVVLFTGDISTSSSIILALPSVLLNAQFSRQMETEADSFALAHLKQNHLEGNNFVAIMTRLEHQHQQQEQHKKNKEDVEVKPKTNSQLGNFSDYFSSHPTTKARIKRFENTH